MKIHYLVTSLETGGAEFTIPDIIKALEQFGHQVDVTACEARDMGAAPYLERAGIPYRLLDTKRRNFFLTLFRILRLLIKNRPDIIWTSLSRATLLGQLAGKILNIPVVSWKNSASIRFTTTVGRPFTRLWVADSYYVARFLHEKMNIPPEKITAWPLYVAAPNTHPAPDWNGQTRLHIGSTGRLHEVKNYPLLIEGIALFRERHPQWADLVHLSFAGDGPQRAELETLIQKYGLEKHVSLKGFQTNVSAFLSTLQLYAQPSRYEGMCLAAHEAMNMSLPVIATPVGEMRNSVQPGKTGFLLQPDRIPETFCDILAEIFQNPSLLHRYGEAAKQHIQQHYSREVFLQRCKQISERLLGDLEETITEYHASTHSVRGNHFRFQRHTHQDGRLAFNNGFRAALTILITSFIANLWAGCHERKPRTGNNKISQRACRKMVCGLGSLFHLYSHGHDI